MGNRNFSPVTKIGSERQIHWQNLPLNPEEIPPSQSSTLILNFYACRKGMLAYINQALKTGAEGESFRGQFFFSKVLKNTTLDINTSEEMVSSRNVPVQRSSLKKKQK